MAAMALDLYPCRLWRDRPYPLSVLMGPVELERFSTSLDLRDGRSMNAAIVAGASRHGPRRDLTLYQLDVYHPRTGELLHSYRYTAYLADEGASPYLRTW
jgi:hypothetical protein